MPRTKGSKSRPKLTNDYDSQIAEKRESIASLNAQITSITANIDDLKVDLTERKTALKKEEKEMSVVKKLLANGMSADEILEKLK